MIGFDDLPRGLPRKLSKHDTAPRAMWVPPEGLNQTPQWGGGFRPETPFEWTAPLVGQDRNGNWLCLDDDGVVCGRV